MKPALQFIIAFGTLMLFLFPKSTFSQLGLCNGNTGTPIFTFDFGTGPNPATNPLPAEITTTYTFRRNFSPDSRFSVVNSVPGNFGWVAGPDHTPGDTDGLMLIFGASNAIGTFFEFEINGLCENTTYEFSAWMRHLSPQICRTDGGNPYNVRFEIDDNSGAEIASGVTGDVSGGLNPQWDQHGLVFTTRPGETSVTLRMVNNGVGGCGNDIAIDDIVFRTCGDSFNTIDNNNLTNTTICEGDFIANPTELDANPNGAVFTSYTYQWQESTDNTNWTDIGGANAQTYTPMATVGTRYFRAIAAEAAVNLTNNNCNVISDTYQLTILPYLMPPTSSGHVEVCEGFPAVMEVTPAVGETVDWYDVATGGTPFSIGSNSVTAPDNTMGTRTYYAESRNTTTGCTSETRTPIQVTVNSTPDLLPDQNDYFCEGEHLTLDAGIAGQTYLWSTDEDTQQITVTTPGTYSVQVTNATNCLATRNFIITENPAPALTSNGDVTICSNETIPSLSVTTANTNTVNWYDAPNGGNMLAGNTTMYTPMTAGTYYAEATNNTTNCTSLNRVAVQLNITPAPIPADENRFFCEGSGDILDAGIPGQTYHWSTGDTTQQITTEVAGTYTVTITNAEGCSAIKTIVLVQNNAPMPPVGNTPTTICDMTNIDISVTVPANTMIEWYDTAIGGTPIETNTNTLNVSNSGSYFAEAVDTDTGCRSLTRTEVVVNSAPRPVLEDETFTICEGETATLTAAYDGGTYLWENGQTSQEINVDQSGVYAVDITTAEGCPTFQLFTVDVIPLEPIVINTVTSDHRDIIVEIADWENYLYSLDGSTYQEEPVFKTLRGGEYTIFIQSKDGCNHIEMAYTHIVVPKFFTPNGDGVNEFFAPEGLEDIEDYSINIFDRYGKLIASSNQLEFQWDGTYNGQPVLASDYWYAITAGTQMFKGHVALKR